MGRRVGNLFVLALAVSSLSLLGCDDEGGGSGSVTVAELPGEVGSAQCEWATRCGMVPNQEYCEAGFNVEGSQSWADMMADLDRGLITYDGEKAAECLAAFRNQTCEGDGDAPAACDETFTGTLANGAECWSDESCVSGYCEESGSCEEVCCVGVCAPTTSVLARPAEGEACNWDSWCEGGTFCLENGTGENGEGVCTAQLGSGAACSGWDQCLAPLECDIDWTTYEGTCATPPAVGEACTVDGMSCQGNAFCDATTLRCVEPKPVGGACDPEEWGQCVAYAECIAGVCTLDPTLGEACDENGDLHCFGDLECQGGVCVAPASAQACPR